MQKISNTESLREAIEILALEKSTKEQELKIIFVQTFDAFKPMNLFKSAVHDLVASKDVRNDLQHTVLGLGTGFLANQIITLGTSNPLVKIMGHVVDYGVTRMVASSPKNFGAIGKRLLQMFTGNKSKVN